ncbi:MAG: RNA polymerase sigma factor [Candidatus Acidiferrales bacterium]
MSDEQRTPWTDTRLVQECLRGKDEAWSALIDKYKNLIFSIPIKYGFSPDDATDIFQSVCLEMLSELPKLRKAKALPKWIMQVTAHKCFHHKRQLQRIESPDSDGEPLEQSTPARAEGILRQAEEEQALRQAMSDLPPRCRHLIQMLFFEEPARPYQILASELGLSTGSIGFIRQRCLDRLRKRLNEAGFS